MSVHVILAVITTLFLAISAYSQAQATTADLSGTVTDPNGAVVAGAAVSARSTSTGLVRTTTSNTDGLYTFVGLPPGEYEISAEAANFKKVIISGIKLTVGQAADLTIKLEVGAQSAVVNVSSDDVQLVEPTRTTVANTIDQTRIANLPINERSATGFALTISTVGRDNGRPIGPAPTSGLNIGGQRGRSTLVQVDGADFTDNSVNASRSTVSQEAVQEYQVTTNSYMPEFGRATGGIINVVTKRGGNDLAGNVFGFVRHRSIQARNAMAPLINGEKPPYTRAQYGFTIGGPIKKDRTHFFGSFEQRRRQESGYFTGDIVGGATSSVTIGAPFLPFTNVYNGLTPAQATYVQGLLGSGNPLNISTAISYATLASAGFQTAQNGKSTLISPGGAITAGTVIGQRFFISGAPVPLTVNADGQYIAFRPLAQLLKVFPISEGTTYSSFRLDHSFNTNNQFNFRVSYNPSRITGIQDESQNQTLGQNDFSRTGIQDIKDTGVGASWTRVISSTLLNELYYNYGRRKALFESQIPSVALQIAGTGFIGANPFSPVDRIETRNQIRDNLNWIVGRHTTKFGVDLGWVNGKARFDLNFPALFNFSQQSCSGLIPGSATQTRCTGPAFTPIQAYGLGYPSVFIQGFGDPNSTLKNRPIAFFGQDTWRITKRITINYGLRYDYEFTEQFAPTPFKDPLTGISLSASDIQAAQDAAGITQGYPRDKNNIAPRFGFAWDIAGNGRTVLRGAIGRFFDHPALASSFISNIGDGSQQQQATLLPISPASNQLLNAFQVMHGTVCGVQGSVPALCAGGNTLGVASSAQYLYGQMRFNPSTFTGFGPILPFTLHVGKNFEYPDAVQANLSVERMIGRSTSISASYIMVNSHHLNHPEDINPPNTDLLRENFRRFAVNNPNFPGCTTATPTASSCFPADINTASFFYLQAGLTTSNALFTVVIPGLIAVNNTTGQRIVNPIAANFFRPLGPNYFFPAAITGGAVTKAVFDAQLAGTVRTPGPISPFGDISAQLSDGNSSYNAMNLELKKRLSTNFQFLASYTWAHSIDDSSDLQTLLKPQNNRNMRAERSDSLFDQRHRFVFSGVINAPENWKNGSAIRRFMHGFSFAPILEISSGRPFNILAVGDSNGDFQSTNERPSVRSDGSLCATGVDANCLNGIFPADGTLGRNMGLTHSYVSLDARLTRSIRFGERFRLDLIAEGFNLFNRFNEAAANPFYNVVNAFGQRSGNGRYYSQSTSAFDPRQFQFGMKLHF